MSSTPAPVRQGDEHEFAVRIVTDLLRRLRELNVDAVVILEPPCGHCEVCYNVPLAEAQDILLHAVTTRGNA